MKPLASEELRPPGKTAELRCACGRLLVRIEGMQIALKCPRCKRQALLRIDALSDAEVEVRFS